MNIRVRTWIKSNAITGLEIEDENIPYLLDETTQIYMPWYVLCMNWVQSRWYEWAELRNNSLCDQEDFDKWLENEYG